MHCCRALTLLSSSTNTFVPVVPFLLEVSVVVHLSPAPLDQRSLWSCWLPASLHVLDTKARVYRMQNKQRADGYLCHKWKQWKGWCDEMFHLWKKHQYLVWTTVWSQLQELRSIHIKWVCVILMKAALLTEPSSKELIFPPCHVWSRWLAIVCVNASCGHLKTAGDTNSLGLQGVVSAYLFLTVWPEW